MPGVASKLVGNGLNLKVVKDDGTALGTEIARAGGVARVDKLQRDMMFAGLSAEVKAAITKAATGCTQAIRETNISYDLATLFVFDIVNKNLSKSSAEEVGQVRRQLEAAELARQRQEQENNELRRQMEEMREMMMAMKGGKKVVKKSKKASKDDSDSEDDSDDDE